MPIFNTRVIGITPCAAVQDDNTDELDDDASNERIGVLLRSSDPNHAGSEGNPCNRDSVSD